MVTLKRFYCEMEFFFWKMYQRQSGGSGCSHHQLAICLFVFVPVLLLLFWLHMLPSLREYNAVGMTITRCAAGFPLFVYSIRGIMLNKFTLEICLVSWDLTVLQGSHMQAPHISF